MSIVFVLCEVSCVVGFWRGVLGVERCSSLPGEELLTIRAGGTLPRESNPRGVVLFIIRSLYNIILNEAREYRVIININGHSLLSVVLIALQKLYEIKCSFICSVSTINIAWYKRSTACQWCKFDVHTCFPKPSQLVPMHFSSFGIHPINGDYNIHWNLPQPPKVFRKRIQFHSRKHLLGIPEESSHLLEAFPRILLLYPM